jgi:hypothetical protein
VWGVTDLMAAERDPSPTTSGGTHSALYEAIRQATRQLLEEAGTTLGVLGLVLKWVGVALLVIACLMAVYLGAGLLGELAVWATYP